MIVFHIIVLIHIKFHTMNDHVKTRGRSKGGRSLLVLYMIIIVWSLRLYQIIGEFLAINMNVGNSGMYILCFGHHPGRSSVVGGDCGWAPLLPSDFDATGPIRGGVGRIVSLDFFAYFPFNHIQNVNGRL